MNKSEAISAMKQGKKVRHRYFSPDEWVTIRGSNYLFEDGVRCSPPLFWYDRQSEDWLIDWEEFIEPKQL